MHGSQDMVTLLGNGPTGGTDLKEAREQNRTITFQKKDESDNVIYSWTFKGNDIVNPMDMDFDILLDETPSLLESQAQKLVKPLYLTFEHEGELPGKSQVYINVGNRFGDNENLSLYYFNEKENRLDLIQENLTASAGYITIEITHCSSYALALGMSGGVPGSVWLTVLAIGLTVGGISLWFILSRIKKRKALSTEKAV